MAKYGIVISSHVEEIAQGIAHLLEEVKGDVCVTYAGGNDEGGVGSSFDKVAQAIHDNTAPYLLCFYDLGSAKMTLEMALDLSGKEGTIYDTALLESAFSATVLANAQMDLTEIQAQLEPLKIK